MKLLKIVIPVLLLALIISVIYFTPRLVKVRTIECRSQFGPCQEELRDRLDANIGSSLYVTKAKIKDYFQSDKIIKDYSFQFQIPDRLIVNVIEEKAKYALTDSAKSTFSLVDEGGNVVEIKSTSNLPLVISPERPANIGENIGSNNLFALEIINNLYSLYQVKEGKIENNSLIVQLPEGFIVVFPLEGDREILLGSLELILFRLKSEPKDTRIENVVKIDLRFKNPVLQ